MKTLKTIFILLFFIFSGCDKKNKEPVTEEPPPLNTNTDTILKCQNLPPSPKPFGWQDTLTDEEKNVNTFMYSPLNPDQLIYVVNGTVFGGFNKLYSYNIPTKQSVLLGSNVSYLPQINQMGWIVYSDMNSDLWKIKMNGDSLTRLSNDQTSENPKWDFTGNFIYYFQKAKNNVAAQLVKITKDGAYVNSFFVDLPYSAAFKKSDKLIYLKIKNNAFVTLILRNMVVPGETDLITGPIESISGHPNFDNLCLDNTDENFYWSNSNGIFSCNISTLKIDTLFKNCENFIYDHPIISFKENELYYNHHIKKPLTVYKLFHEYKSMELNLISKQTSEVKIFP